MKGLQFSHAGTIMLACGGRPEFFAKKQSKSTHAFLLPERIGPLHRCTLEKATCEGAKKTDPTLVRKALDPAGSFKCVQRLKCSKFVPTN